MQKWKIKLQSRFYLHMSWGRIKVDMQRWKEKKHILRIHTRSLKGELKSNRSFFSEVSCKMKNVAHLNAFKNALELESEVNHITFSKEQ